MSENIFEIEPGYYQAKPTCCGLVKTTNGHRQFAIECAIEVPVDGAAPRTVVMTKFQNLAEQGLEYAMQDVENCGGDVSKGIEEWNIDATRSVRVHVTKDEFGTKLKSIFSNDRQGGFLIKKMALDEGEKAEAVIGYNERIAALRALRAQNSGQPTPAPVSNGAKPVTKPADTSAAPKVKVPF